MHSSTSIAIRLRNSIVVGFISTSPSEITGNSSGNPPALQTPRLTASATWRRWALQLLSSDQEFAMPTTGRPSKTRSLKPSVLSHERWAKPSRSRRPNQLRLLSGCAVIGPSGVPIIEEKETAHATGRQGGGGDGRGQRHRAGHRAGDGARGRGRLDPRHPGAERGEGRRRDQGARPQGGRDEDRRHERGRRQGGGE